MLELMILAVLFVNADGTGQYPTIQAAVDASQNGDEVVLTDGIFTGPGNWEVHTLGKAITIQSDHSGFGRIDLDLHTGFRIDQGEGPDTILRGLVIHNGLTDNPYEPMGVIAIGQSSPRIEDCKIYGNLGTAISNAGGSPLITGCFFEENSSNHHASVIGSWDTGSFLTLLNCEIQFNDTHCSVGNVYIEAGFVDNCIFSNNYTTGYGASLMAGSRLKVYNSWFRGEAETAGGGLTAIEGSFFKNCSFLGTAPLGAAVYVLNGGDTQCVVFDNCTFDPQDIDKAPGACLTIRETRRATMQANVPLAVSNASWGQIKAAYRQ